MAKVDQNFGLRWIGTSLSLMHNILQSRKISFCCVLGELFRPRTRIIQRFHKLTSLGESCQLWMGNIKVCRTNSSVSSEIIFLCIYFTNWIRVSESAYQKSPESKILVPLSTTHSFPLLSHEQKCGSHLYYNNKF